VKGWREGGRNEKLKNIYISTHTKKKREKSHTTFTLRPVLLFD
jgi:hypothetical protein